MIFNFNSKHYELIEKEFGVDKAVLDGMTENELDDFYEKVLAIELAETPNNSNDMSERGEAAVEIVNIMAEALGYMQEDEDE